MAAPQQNMSGRNQGLRQARRRRLPMATAFLLGACFVLPALPPAATALPGPRTTEPPPVSTQLAGGELVYTVVKGDSQTLVGAKLGVDPGSIAAANGLSPRAWLRIGQKLKIDNRHLVPRLLPDGILINIPQRMLFFFREGKLVRAFPVAVGRPDWQTPAGSYHVLEKIVDKTWKVPPSIQKEMHRKGERVRRSVPPGPQNPLGRHWMRISPDCGIHATNAPASIYRFGTHGCIRLQPENAEELFQKISVGAPVEVIYQPVLLGRAGDTLYLESSPDPYGEVAAPLDLARAMAAEAGWTKAIDWEKAAQVIGAHDGIARPVGHLPR
jgi:L,D-transpeptidase ErfK/SrfK